MSREPDIGGSIVVARLFIHMNRLDLDTSSMSCWHSKGP